MANQPTANQPTANRRCDNAESRIGSVCTAWAARRFGWNPQFSSLDQKVLFFARPSGHPSCCETAAILVAPRQRTGAVAKIPHFSSLFSRKSSEQNIVPLDAGHVRVGFTCGVDSLDRYIQLQAGQDVRRRASKLFVLVAKSEPGRLPGYYTLCATSLPLGDVPEAARRLIPRYPLVSATLLGRLAVAGHRQGQQLGAVLLADALRRALASAETVGSSMIMVDALDEGAAAFYATHGFIRLPESLRLVLPMRTVAQLVVVS
jgi:GNAT superfamily N-acetyltransferase